MNSKSKIKNLTASDVDITFSRDLSENILTKTQALLNLKDAKIPPEIANAVIHLFSDPVAVTKMQEAYIQELDKKELAKNSKNESNINENVSKNKESIK